MVQKQDRLLIDDRGPRFQRTSRLSPVVICLYLGDPTRPSIITLAFCLTQSEPGSPEVPRIDTSARAPVAVASVRSGRVPKPADKALSLCPRIREPLRLDAEEFGGFLAQADVSRAGQLVLCDDDQIGAADNEARVL